MNYLKLLNIVRFLVCEVLRIWAQTDWNGQFRNVEGNDSWKILVDQCGESISRINLIFFLQNEARSTVIAVLTFGLSLWGLKFKTQCLVTNLGVIWNDPPRFPAFSSWMILTVFEWFIQNLRCTRIVTFWGQFQF